MSETRKLVVILVADVVGYSRLTGADEDRILARLRALRSDLSPCTTAVSLSALVGDCRLPRRCRCGELRHRSPEGDGRAELDALLEGQARIALRAELQC
jgi:hypothetical protein